MSAVAKIMPPVAFDTLVFANKLKAVGLDAKIAEAQAGLLSEIFSEAINDRLATKQDWLEIKYESKKHSDRISKVEDRLDKIEIEIANIHCCIEKLKNDLLIKLGGIVVACTTILGTITAVLSHVH